MSRSYTLICLMFALMPPAMASQLPAEYKLVEQYILERDYPELFEDKSYRLQVQNVLVEDLDNDGRPEVILHVKPHYRQSPPLVIYQIDENQQVRRLVEGLAPGPLVAVDGDYLDSHTLGAAVDFTIEAKGSKLDAEAHHQAALKVIRKFGGVVEYNGFVHADSRSGGGMYVDMRHIKEIPGGASCEAFQFSDVKHIAVRRKEGDPAKYIIALTEDALWVYRIAGITADGFLDKSVASMPLGK